MRDIVFELGGYKVDIRLRQRITILSGDSATGKSFIYSLIQSYETISVTGKLICIDASSSDSKALLGKLAEIKDDVIIIDNANYVLRNKDILKKVKSDYQDGNYYLLMGRDLPLYLCTDYIADPVIADGKVWIEYLFEEEDEHVLH